MTPHSDVRFKFPPFRKVMVGVRDENFDYMNRVKQRIKATDSGN